MCRGNGEKCRLYIATHSLDFFLGPGRALGFGPSTPAPKPRFDPVLGLEAFVVFLALGALTAGCGVSAPAVSSGGKEASGLTSTDFDSSSGVGASVVASWSFLMGGMDKVDSSRGSRANNARALLGSLKQRILLGLDPLLPRFDDGGVDTLERVLETRRTELLDFALGGILTRCGRE